MKTYKKNKIKYKKKGGGGGGGRLVRKVSQKRFIGKKDFFFGQLFWIEYIHYGKIEMCNMYPAM